MTLLVADTSSLVSLGCAEHYTPSALELLFEGFEVVVPGEVESEVRDLASYEHDHRGAAKAAQSALTDAQIQPVASISESVPPLDSGERAAIELANEEGARYLLCDEFNNLTLITSALRTADLLTTPALITAFVNQDVVKKTDAQAQLADIATMRSWENNAYYQRMKRKLDQLS